jgi:hypothetical protein
MTTEEKDMFVESRNSAIASTISILSESSSDSSDSDGDQIQGITIHELCVSGTLHEVTYDVKFILSFSKYIKLFNYFIDKKVCWPRAS